MDPQTIAVGAQGAPLRVGMQLRQSEASPTRMRCELGIVLDRADYEAMARALGRTPDKRVPDEFALGVASFRLEMN